MIGRVVDSKWAKPITVPFNWLLTSLYSYITYYTNQHKPFKFTSDPKYIETGAFEVADDLVSAAKQLSARVPDTQTWFVRIGHSLGIFSQFNCYFLCHHLSALDRYYPGS